MPSPNQPNFYYDPMNPAQYLQYSSGTHQQFNRWEQSYQQDQQSYQHFDQQAFQQQSPFHDDSDSSEHNKSVQVESEEEEEEPVKPTGMKTIGKKAPAKRWTDEEEVALARSWLTISENPDVGDEHVLIKAMKDYKSVVKSKGFPHIQAWELVCYNSLWCDIPSVGCQSQSTTKRPKPNESMGSASSHINLDDDEDVEGQHDRDGPRIYYEPDRPTRKGKRSAASSSSQEELIQQMTEFNSFNKEESQQRIRLREEKLRVFQEEKDARIQLMRRQQQALDEQQKAVDLEFMMKDHTIYQEPMLQLILDRKREIAAR
ncbi:hypothetical protein R6Q59_002831 [Mikania micrantha]